jgi:adenylate cyclase
VKGNVVFIGMSEDIRTEQKDGFHTVFSGEGGLDLSGVEIAATAFANLAEQAPVRPLRPAVHAALVVAAGLLLGALAVTLSPLWAAAAIVAIGTGYLVTARIAFTASALWCPLVVPLLIQAPLAFVAAVWWQYSETNRERRRIREAFAHYLPEAAIDEMLSQLRGARTAERVVRGICVATDAEQYTTLAESMEPAELARFMNMAAQCPNKNVATQKLVTSLSMRNHGYFIVLCLDYSRNTARVSKLPDDQDIERSVQVKIPTWQ